MWDIEGYMPEWKRLVEAEGMTLDIVYDLESQAYRVTIEHPEADNFASAYFENSPKEHPAKDIDRMIRGSIESLLEAA
jgi:hypothetical protein